MKVKKRNPLFFRIHVLFFTVFLLFSSLILRLGFVQIVKGEEYKEKSEKMAGSVYTWNTPRGKIYDRNGELLVTNEPIYTVTYTNPSGATEEERLYLARKLARFLSIEIDDISLRDKKSYWIQTKGEKATILSEEEQNKLNRKEEYNLLLDRLKETDISEITDEELEVIKIKKIMEANSASVKIIKEGLTIKERATINEHLSELPGIEIKLNSKRKYQFGESLRQIFGSVGYIPQEEVRAYQALGYELDDQVGISFLELQYEKLLRGIKERKVYELDAAGNIVGEARVTKGEPGNNLVLTIDMNLQQKVEKIIEEELKKVKGAESAYVIMMDPNTGGILSIAGKSKDGKGFNDEAYGVLYNAYAMGSAVKGATVLTGYEAGVISPGSTFLDAPIMIRGTPIKKSYVNMGVINDLTALERSSNVYMFHVAMKIGNYDYAEKEGFENPNKAYATMRNGFAQFGLGVKTGIDLPSEASGLNGGVQRLGNLMDFAIGQFDTYTPLQLAQYISTIANDGVRMQPHLLKEVRDPVIKTNEPGKLIKTFSSNVLNTLDLEDEYIERVQKGFWLVMNGNQGTATSSFNDAHYNPAGKTGTAQVPDGEGGYDYNLTLVGYAPYDDPEVAFSVVVPGVDHDSSGVNKTIGRRILDAYFNEISDAE